MVAVVMEEGTLTVLPAGAYSAPDEWQGQKAIDGSTTAGTAISLAGDVLFAGSGKRPPPG